MKSRSCGVQLETARVYSPGEIRTPVEGPEASTIHKDRTAQTSTSNNTTAQTLNAQHKMHNHHPNSNTQPQPDRNNGSPEEICLKLYSIWIYFDFKIARHDVVDGMRVDFVIDSILGWGGSCGSTAPDTNIALPQISPFFPGYCFQIEENLYQK